jgi:hypothetical protein
MGKVVQPLQSVTVTIAVLTVMSDMDLSHN